MTEDILIEPKELSASQLVAIDEKFRGRRKMFDVDHLVDVEMPRLLGHIAAQDAHFRDLMDRIDTLRGKLQLTDTQSASAAEAERARRRQFELDEDRLVAQRDEAIANLHKALGDRDVQHQAAGLAQSLVAGLRQELVDAQATAKRQGKLAAERGTALEAASARVVGVEKALWVRDEQVNEFPSLLAEKEKLVAEREVEIKALKHELTGAQSRIALVADSRDEVRRSLRDAQGKIGRLERRIAKLESAITTEAGAMTQMAQRLGRAVG